MLEWLADKLQQRGIDAFLAQLQGMESDEVAAVVVLAALFRNQYRESLHVDFLQPREATRADPALIMKLGVAAKQLGRDRHAGKLNYSALMVWIHTLRATLNPRLEEKTRQMWGELSRGHTDLEAGARQVESLTGQTTPLGEATRFPEGFAPGPSR